MSRNLHLSAKNDTSISLVQTPTHVTNDAMKLYDKGSTGDAAAAHAIKVYKQHLLDTDWDKEDLESKIREIEVFLAFSPGARFYGY